MTDTENSHSTLEIDNDSPLSDFSTFPDNPPFGRYAKKKVHPEVRKIARSLSRYISKRFHRYDISEDLEQDFYLRMLEKGIDLSVEPQAFLYRYGKHWLIDKWRSRRYDYNYFGHRKQHLDIAPYLQEFAENQMCECDSRAPPDALIDNTNPANMAVDNITVAKIKEIVGQDYFSFLFLRYIEGYTANEIADSLPIGENMVNRKIRLAKQIVQGKVI